MFVIEISFDQLDEIGRHLRELRTAASLSQAELAQRIGTTQSAVSRWENGRDEPRMSTIAPIARACDRSARLTFDDGVDRAQIREHLALTPTERLQAVANVSRLRAAAVRRPVTA